MTQNNFSLPTLLEVKHIKIRFPLIRRFWGQTKQFIDAVNDVSFSLFRGKTLGIVGESGSGKTILCRSLIRLAKIESGSICYEGQELSSLSDRGFFPFRKKIQMIFQDPYHSLNPRMTLLQILSEPLEIHFKHLGTKAHKKRILELLDFIRLDQQSLNRYPFEFSGGQRQRIGIARALAVEPECLICDEPVSALDVSIQAQILKLLKELQQQFSLTLLFVAHDLAVVQQMSDDVIVMKEGKIIETASADMIYQNPQTSYTKQLLAAIPKIDFDS